MAHSAVSDASTVFCWRARYVSGHATGRRDGPDRLEELHDRDRLLRPELQALEVVDGPERLRAVDVTPAADVPGEDPHARRGRGLGDGRGPGVPSTAFFQWAKSRKRKGRSRTTPSLTAFVYTVM